jgi:ATP-dependent RNA circularization protein (DNA/RNA ligase family)
LNEPYFKFPTTPHLEVLGNVVLRDDKVMSEKARNDFLKQKIVVEEKVDGANLGISFNHSGDLRLQSRGSLIQEPFNGQWKKINEWLNPKIDIFFDCLQNDFILFGEWCYAQHSISYDKLPDWFLGFDIYDKKKRFFLPCQKRNILFQKIRVSAVPLIRIGLFTIEDLKGLLSMSLLCDKPAEGLYLRIEDQKRLIKRAKLVRPEFIQIIEEHWSRKPIIPNPLPWAGE